MTFERYHSICGLNTLRVIDLLTTKINDSSERPWKDLPEITGHPPKVEQIHDHQVGRAKAGKK
jgi:hypothetical protein